MLAAVLIGATLALTPAAAQASPGQTADDPTRATMTRVGVDHEIAARSGYEVRVDENGIEYSVKKGAPPTRNRVSGTCGWSWLYFTAVDRQKHYTSIDTGFELATGFAGAIFVKWNVTVIDRFGVSTKPWNDPAASVHYWHKVKGFTSSGTTSVTGEVVIPSIATLSDGTICYSHGPTATAQL